MSDDGTDHWFSPCEVCGGTVTGFAVEAVTEEFRELVEVWPGGPVLEDPSSFPQLHVAGYLLTVSPCGHDNSLETFRMYERRAA